MRLDVITEDIWHFIGSFQQLIEAGRNRDVHDAWRAQQAQEKRAELQLLESHFKAPHLPVDFKPGIKMAIRSEEDAKGLTRGTQAHQSGKASPPPLAEIVLAPVVPLMAVPLVSPGAQAGSAIAPLPGSNAVILGQSNHLSDQDILIQTDLGARFLPFSAVDRQLETLVVKAEALVGLPRHDHPESVEAFRTIAENATNFPVGEGQAVMRGDDAIGLHVNGTRTDTPLILEDVLPEVPEPVTLGPDTTREAEIAADAGTDPAHVAVLGGNSLVNEVVLSVSWLDAPVMLVQGDAISVSVIAQVNVLSDTDTGICAPNSQNQMVNLAEYGLAAAPRTAPDASDTAAMPTNWNVTTLDADLIVCNWVSQQNFVIDHDILSVSWAGSGSFLRLGDNTLVNLANLQELGWGYDVIVIGGDMINVSMIRQMNVLLDDDWVQIDGGAATVVGSGNLLWNSASISGTGRDSLIAMDGAHADLIDTFTGGSSGTLPIALSNPSFAGTGVLNVLYITGDYISLAMIDQTNVLGDADQVMALATEAVAASDADVTVVTGANALVNLATINTLGIDTEIHVGGEIYSDAMIYQADFFATGASDPYGPDGPSPLASEAVVFLADGILSDDTTVQLAPMADSALVNGQADGVNAVLV